MKILVNSKGIVESIRKTAPASTVDVFSKENLKDIKKSAHEIDLFILYYQQSSRANPGDTLPLLRRLASEVPDIPVFVLDRKFSLSHHNNVTNFPNVVAYGQTGHPVIIGELRNIIEAFKKRDAVRKKTTTLSEDEIKPVGWSIQITKEVDFKDDFADKLYFGEMRVFINNLKKIIDKVRPKEFIPDHTRKKPLLDWLEMWHAYKLGASHYHDPNSDSKKEINIKDIEEARKLLEAKRTNPNIQHILIRGETGAGKTFIAHFIHNYFYRTCKKGWYKERPTIVSCPELQGNLAVPTLFGCLAGAWTDSRTRVGYLLESYNGTLFLDEIGAASPGIQEKLLRYLDYQSFRPDGWSLQEGIFVPLLVVAATNQDIKAMVKQKTFREDLYYRFLEIEIPPLRSCKDYLDVYIDCELQNPRTNDGYIESITVDAIEFLKGYKYPGNFREFHRILGLAVEKARSMRVKTIVKDHVESAMSQLKSFS